MSTEAKHFRPEALSGLKYRDIIAPEIKPMAEFLRYDREGNLWINDLRVIDAVRKYGSPLEIVETTIIEKRCRQWAELTAGVAAEVGFTGGFVFAYANKANMAAEVALAAYRSGWGVEASGAQDLADFHWLAEHGLVDRKLPIICNGFKFLPSSGEKELSYFEYIVNMQGSGFNPLPVLDTGEFELFTQRGVPSMEVGLRLKFGQVTNDKQLETLISRFGMTWGELVNTAGKTENTDHLTFSLLHTMVGAAQTIPVKTFAESLLFAADKYFALKQMGHQNLKYLDIGGGIPPLSERYDHRELLRQFLSGLVKKSQESGFPQPTVVTELGTFAAAEHGFFVAKVIQLKHNHIGLEGSGSVWAIIDGSLMAEIPDVLLTGKQFEVFAANNANLPARLVRLGDISCDPDGRYPTRSREPEKIFLPDAEGTVVVFANEGAYQESLAGIRGVHHCGLPEPAELIIERRKDGQIHERLMPRQTIKDEKDLLGYSTQNLAALRETVSGNRKNI